MAKDMTTVVLAVGLVAMLIIMGVMLIMPQPPVVISLAIFSSTF
jgi:hypothetical protein